jgi:hypothetical protein
MGESIGGAGMNAREGPHEGKWQSRRNGQDKQSARETKHARTAKTQPGGTKSETNSSSQTAQPDATTTPGSTISSSPRYPVLEHLGRRRIPADLRQRRLRGLPVLMGSPSGSRSGGRLGCRAGCTAVIAIRDCAVDGGQSWWHYRRRVSSSSRLFAEDCRREIGAARICKERRRTCSFPRVGPKWWLI